MTTRRDSSIENAADATPAPGTVLGGRWWVTAADRDALGPRCEVYDRQRDVYGVARVLALDGGAVARLRTDLETVAGARSPHLITAGDAIFERARRRATVVRPRVAGCSAGDLLRAAAGGAPLQLVLTLLAQLFDALETLHRAGIVHGAVGLDTVVLEDRAPELLLADPSRDPRARLVDGGLVVWLETRAPRSAAARWQAPESRRGAPLATPADVYAAGCLARALLAGDPERAPSSGLPRGVGKLLATLRARRPGKRPSAAEARAAARELALEQLAVWAGGRRAAGRQVIRAGDPRPISEVGPHPVDDAAIRAWLATLEDDCRAAVTSRSAPPAPIATPPAAPPAETVDAPPFAFVFPSPAAPATGAARRDLATIRAELRRAIYEERTAAASRVCSRLRHRLGPAADGDADVAVATVWLEEQEEARRGREDQRRQARRRARWIVLWTAAPLLFAVFLTGLLLATFLSYGF